eukprot:scaffold295035_cov20-Tisochrysis_lutea.AAC.1
MTWKKKINLAKRVHATLALPWVGTSSLQPLLTSAAPLIQFTANHKIDGPDCTGSKQRRPQLIPDRDCQGCQGILSF